MGRSKTVAVIGSTAVESAPVKIMQGTFAVYRTPEGGAHIAYIAEGTEVTEHIEFPPMNSPADIIKAARALTGGSMGNIIRAMAGGLGG